MRTAFLSAPETIELKTVPDLSCGPDEILIRVVACGMCGSDVRIFHYGNKRVQFPATIGHEVAGIVVEKGNAVSDVFHVGDRVALGADIPCGTCYHCVEGNCNNCQENIAIGYQLPGGFAEYLKIDARIWSGGPIQKIPENISFEEAALAEPVACAINGMEILPNKTHGTILIIGAGVLGCLLSELARIYHYQQVFLADDDLAKLSFIKERGYAADSFLTSDKTLPERIRELTKGRGVDAVMVACPDLGAQRLALDCLGPRGAVNFFAGLPSGSDDLLFPSNLIHYNELYVTGSHGSTPDQHLRALDFIGRGQVRVKNLITHRFSLADLAQAFARAENSQNRLKVMILPGEETT